MPNEDKEFIKSMLIDSAFTSFGSYNYNSEISLTKNERLTLNNLINNKNIIIKKCGKGNSVVLLDKDKYLGQGSTNCAHGDERAHKEVFAYAKLRARKSIKSL